MHIVVKLHSFFFPNLVSLVWFKRGQFGQESIRRSRMPTRWTSSTLYTEYPKFSDVSASTKACQSSKLGETCKNSLNLTHSCLLAYWYLFCTDLPNSHAWKAPSFHTTEGSPSICTGTKPKIGIDFGVAETGELQGNRTRMLWTWRLQKNGKKCCGVQPLCRLYWDCTGSRYSGLEYLGPNFRTLFCHRSIRRF